jgi:hypothetical protein
MSLDDATAIARLKKSAAVAFRRQHGISSVKALISEGPG